MTTTHDLPPFESRLLSELTQVVEEQQQGERGPARGSRGRVAAVAAGIAVVGVALAIAPGLSRDGGSAAFAVRELPDGVIQVDWATDLDDGEAVAAELREFGIDVDIITVPSSPSAVGAVHSLEAPVLDEEPGFVWDDIANPGATTFSIDPAVFRGGLTLYLSVEAAPGEAYEVREEVFEPGEVLGGLHCALGEPLRAEQLAPHLDELELEATWLVVSPDPADPEVMYSEPVVDGPDGEVLWGYALDDRAVEVTVRPDGVDLGEAFPPRLSDVPCSPEQADAWS